MMTLKHFHYRTWKSYRLQSLCCATYLTSPPISFVWWGFSWTFKAPDSLNMVNQPNTLQITGIWKDLWTISSSSERRVQRQAPGFPWAQINMASLASSISCSWPHGPSERGFPAPATCLTSLQRRKVCGVYQLTLARLWAHQVSSRLRRTQKFRWCRNKIGRPDLAWGPQAWLTRYWKWRPERKVKTSHSEEIFKN